MAVEGGREILKEPIPDDLFLAGETVARNILAFQERLFGIEKTVI